MNFTASKKDFIDTKTKLEDVNAELANTNSKFDRVRQEMTNGIVDLTVKLDGNSIKYVKSLRNKKLIVSFLRYSHQEGFHRH